MTFIDMLRSSRSVALALASGPGCGSGGCGAGVAQEPGVAQGNRAGDLQGGVRHHRRQIRRRGASRLGAQSRADRFYNLVKNGFYDDTRFFRVVPNFMVQFGMNGDPAVTTAWAGASMKDEPTKQSNKRGYVTFARTGAPNSRGTQMFINYKDNAFLDAPGLRAVRRGHHRHGRGRQDQRAVR